MAESFDDEGFVAGKFDAIKVYDAPMVALSQLFEGEASFRSLRDTFMDPASLSPAERDSFTSRLKDSLGNNPIANGFIDVALNPFVWLMFATTPAAGQALKSGAKTFSGLAKKAKDSQGADYFKFVTGKYSVLSTLGLLNAHQLGAGTPLSSILHSASSRFSELTRQDTLNIQPMVSEALDNISKKFGTSVRSLNPDDAPVATATINGEAISLKEYLKKFNVYAHIHMSGMNKTLDRTEAIISDTARVHLHARGGTTFKSFDITPSQSAKLAKFQNSAMRFRELVDFARKEGRDDSRLIIAHNKILNDRFKYLKKNFPDMGDEFENDLTARVYAGRDKLEYFDDEAPLSVFTTTKRYDAIDPENFSGDWLQREGFMPLLGQSRTMMKGRYVDLFGNKEVFEKTGKIEYDDNKLLRIFRALSDDKGSKTAEEISNVLHKELQGYVGGDGYKKIIQAMTPDKQGRTKMSLQQFKDVLRVVRESGDDTDNFMSRNVWSYVERGADGNPVKMRTDSVRVHSNDRAANLSGRVQERNSTDPIIDSDDLKILKNEYDSVGSVSTRLDDAYKKSVHWEMNSPAKSKMNRSQVMNLDYGTSFNRYLKQTRNDVVLHVDDAYSDTFIRRLSETDDASYKQILKNIDPRRTKDTEILGGMDLGASRYRLLQLTSDVMASNPDSVGRFGGENARNYVMNTLVNRMRGEMPLRDMISEHVTLNAVRLAGAMSKSKAFQSIKKMGGIPAKFVQTLENYGDLKLSEAQGGKLGRLLTETFYASHLGVNLGSAMLNLMQPLMYAASWMDPDVMIKAYGQAFKQYFGYLRERVKMPLRADPLLVDDLRAKFFRLSNVGTKERPLGMDLLDIRATDFELMDSQAFAAESALKKSGKASFEFWRTEAPLKLFTHSEIFNRTVTGEAMLGQMIKNKKLSGLNYKNGVYQVGGDAKGFADVEVVENVREMVQNTQFGSDLINSPELFQKTGFGIPWVRQFFTFPVRTLTAWTDTAPMVNQGRRTWGLTGFETQGRFSAMMHDMTRMMGTGAIAYEMGKNVAGIDLSRGLAGQTLYESTIVGPLFVEPDSDAAYNLPLSPAFSTIRDASQALMEDDVSLIGSLAPRFIPGGIAFSRLLNIAPRISEPRGWTGGLQRESADWGQIQPGGQVPIYRADGSLLEYRSAAKTVLGGLGFNSYMFQNDKALNGFLVKNRQEIIGERRKYVDAMLANNPAKAQQIKTAFEKRFKFPLSVTKAQVDSAIQLREVPLKERMYTRMQPQFRPVVRPYLEERIETLKSRTPEELDLSTSKKARLLPSTFDAFDPYSAVTE